MPQVIESAHDPVPALPRFQLTLADGEITEAAH